MSNKLPEYSASWNLTIEEIKIIEKAYIIRCRENNKIKNEDLICKI